VGESNGKLPLKTWPGCSIPEPYRLPDWGLVPTQTSPRAEKKKIIMLKAVSFVQWEVTT